MKARYPWDRAPWYVPKIPILTWRPEKHVKYEVVWANWGKVEEPHYFAIYRNVNRGRGSWYPKAVLSGYIGEFDFKLDVRATKKSVQDAGIPINCLYNEMTEIKAAMEQDYTDNVCKMRVKMAVQKRRQ